MLHHPTAFLVLLAALVFLAIVVRIVAGNPGAARHRVRVLRWRIRLYLRPGAGYANLLELAVRWSRLRAVRSGGRSRPSLPGWMRMFLPVTAYAVRLGPLRAAGHCQHGRPDAGAGRTANRQVRLAGRP